MKIPSLDLLLLLASLAHAMAGDPELKLLKLPNGVNRIDVDKDGQEDTVVVAHRDNWNAHGYLVTTIYMPAPKVEGASPGLHVVPIEITPSKYEINLKTAGGADYLLNDFRLLCDTARHTAVLIVGEREFGNSFGDSQPVNFSFYDLTLNREGIPGIPALYFKLTKKVKSKVSYHDITEAFQDELGLEASR